MNLQMMKLENMKGNHEYLKESGATGIPATVRMVASLHGFVAATSGAICIFLVPSALLSLNAVMAIGFWSSIAVFCLLVRLAMLRGMRVSYVAAIILDVAGAMMLPCLVGSDVLARRSIAVELFVVPVLVSFASIVSLVWLSRHETRGWFVAPRLRRDR